MDHTDEIAAAKRATRATAREARDSIDPAERRLAAQSLSHALLALPELDSARVVLAFAALPTEIDPAPAVWRLRARGAAIAYPRIESPGILAMHLVGHELELVAGPFGLAQPSEHAPHAARDSVDAVIMPGVAFDECGRRLGYGGGYYDRLVPTLRPDCLRIGIAFDEQILPRVPAEAHDARVHILVTPTQVIRIGGSSAN